MRRTAAALVYVGITLMVISALAIVWSEYGQFELRRAWYDAFPGSTTHRNSDRTASNSISRAQPKETLNGSGNPPVGRVPGDVFGRLYFPRVNRETFVLEGSANLARGPAWLTETSRPGNSGNCVISGHRDTHFRFLKDVRKGDEIVLETPQHAYTYRVRSIQIVEPTNGSLLRPERRPVLTLVTCYPFSYIGPAPRRYIVRAELVEGQLAKIQHQNN